MIAASQETVRNALQTGAGVLILLGVIALIIYKSRRAIARFAKNPLRTLGELALVVLAIGAIAGLVAVVAFLFGASWHDSLVIAAIVVGLLLLGTALSGW